MKRLIIKSVIFDTYLAVIKNSIGSKMFRNFYAKVNGQRTDIMQKGGLSCAFYVSSILTLFKMIKEVHTTVDTTVKDLRKSGWRTIRKPKIGSIIVWEKVDFGDGDIHKHIGFYIGGSRAVSNSSQSGCTVKHHLTFRGKRKIETILWNPKLNR